MFQNNAVSGLLMLVGIACNSWLLALFALLGNFVGTLTAFFSGYSKEDIEDGLYGFNGTLVGIAVGIFMETGIASLLLLVAGSVLSTWIARVFGYQKLLPGFTAPFILTVWLLLALCRWWFPSLLLPSVMSEETTSDLFQAFSLNIGQVMFQGGTVLSGLFFLAGILLNSRYLDPECDDATAQAVGEKLAAMPGVTNVQFVSKQDVLNTYRNYMEDYSSLWDEFENDNPFKANYRVSIADLSQMESMSKQMQAIQGVYSVTAPVEMTNVFVQVQRSVTKVGRGIVLVLMVVSIITVGSTIRLSVFARRREIEIMKYVGATNGLVTLPFVVEGLAMGLISGVLTAAISLGGYSYMVQASDGLGGVWEMIMGQALVPVSAVWSTIIPYSLIGGAVVGGLGSMFSIRKHLNV